MKSNSIRLHRVFSAKPEKVFKAFSNSDAMAWWLPPKGFICKIHQFDFTQGGRYAMAFINFSTDKIHSFSGTFLEIKPNESLIYTDTFDDPALPGEIRTTVVLNNVICGTNITVTQEGIPNAIPVEMCYLGWQESLDKLQALVERHVPDA